MIRGLLCVEVRDTYACNEALVLVTTDRQSAFDRQLARVPFKGAVLNQVPFKRLMQLDLLLVHATKTCT